MAKIVTLKNPNDEDIYPVTDASGIRVTGNITLQQALDGFVYADDPTTPTNPDGWITPNDIDWSTFTYSTSEQRVGTWVNGKPVYKKTIDFGSLPNNSTKNVAHGISNLGDVIDIRGTAKTSWGTYQLPLVFSGSDVNYITNVSVNATNISMSNSADRSGFTAYVTLYYTKTTD